MWGAEHWAGTEQDLKPLKTFHHNCLRSTLRISRKHQHENHITTRAIMRRLMVPQITAYADKRALTWLGKIGRMENIRLPRLLLFSWLSGSRKRGFPQAHFGIRARNLLVDMVTTCVPENARVQFHGQTEFNGSEFKRNNISRCWKDFNNWITVAKDERKWKLYVEEFTQTRSYPPHDTLLSKFIKFCRRLRSKFFKLCRRILTFLRCFSLVLILCTLLLTLFTFLCV